MGAVSFSCKRRGFCPKCAAKRAHETEEHLMGLLPCVSYRQWTLTIPSSLRWPVIKDTQLLRSVEKRLLRAIFRWQRQKAKALGVQAKALSGAVSQLQLFSSALALQPHFHVLVPEGVWVNEKFVELPVPDILDVEAVLLRLLKTLERLFLKEEENQAFPQDALERLQHEGAQLKFGWPALPNSKGHLTACPERSRRPSARFFRSTLARTTGFRWGDHNLFRVIAPVRISNFLSSIPAP